MPWMKQQKHAKTKMGKAKAVKMPKIHMPKVPKPTKGFGFPTGSRQGRGSLPLAALFD